MDFQEAVRESIRQYFDGRQPDEYRKSVGSRKSKRNKKYFDQVEIDLGLKQPDDIKEEEDEGDA